jgi:hypothetical protein
VVAGDSAGPLPGAQGSGEGLKCGHLALGRAVATLRRLGGLLQAPLNDFEITHDQLGFDQLGVTNGVDTLVHVANIGVGKGAKHVGDGIHRANVAQEAAAEAAGSGGSAGGLTAGHAGDVDDFDRGIDDAGRLEARVQRVEALIRHTDDAAVGLGGGVGRGHGMTPREGIEERCLADVGQTHDTELHLTTFNVRTKWLDFFSLIKCLALPLARAFTLPLAGQAASAKARSHTSMSVRELFPVAGRRPHHLRSVPPDTHG